MKFRDQSYCQVNAVNEKDLKSKEISFEVISLSLENLNACLELDEISLEGLWSEKQWEKELSCPKRICHGVFNFSKLMMSKGATILGGCCETKPSHIKEISIRSNAS